MLSYYGVCQLTITAVVMMLYDDTTALYTDTL